MRTIFITATDTNVGKTLVSSWIAYHTRANYWKPVQTGTDHDTPVVGRYAAATFPEVYTFPDPLSPHLAAARVSQSIDPEKLRAMPVSDAPLIIEGAGGVLVPLTQTLRMIDLMELWKVPVLVVTRSLLGTFNHTLLTLEALAHRNIPVLGLVIVGEEDVDFLGHAPVLGRLSLAEVQEKGVEDIPLTQGLHEALHNSRFI